jgi:hypothetical protein
MAGLVQERGWMSDIGWVRADTRELVSVIFNLAMIA